MASLEALRSAIFPAARSVGPAARPAQDAGREVEWVRVLRARVPAFEALQAGDLVIIPGPSLAVVAPDAARLEELAHALSMAGLPAVLLVEGDAGSAALAELGEMVAASGVTTLSLGRTDPVALERRIIRALMDRAGAADGTTTSAIPEAPQPAYRVAVDRILRALGAMADGTYVSRELLAPILVGSPEAQGDRLATLRAVLESGSHAEAAARLGVHRNTVAYRIARLEERSGWDLADPDLRLALLVALRFVQNA